MDAMQIQVTDQPAETDWQWLEGTIDQFNMHLTGYQDYRPLAIFVRDSLRAIIAGCRVGVAHRGRAASVTATGLAGRGGLG